MASQNKQEIDYLKVLKIIFSSWYWLAGSLLLSILLAWMYLRYTPPVYSAEASLKFEEKKSELSELISIRNLYDKTNKVESEKTVIRSKTVLLQAMGSMDYNISWFKKGNFKTTDIYPLKPLRIGILKINPDSISSIPFEIENYSQRDFMLSFVLHRQVIRRRLRYGELISIPNLVFRVFRGQEHNKSKVRYLFKFNTGRDFLDRINPALKIDDNQNVNVLQLKITDNNPYFAADALNAILDAYLKFDRMQRSASATQTMKFIDTLLRNMSGTVNTSATDITRFKSGNPFINPTSGSALMTDKYTKLEAEKHLLAIQTLLIRQQEQHLRESGNHELPNASLQGNSDPQLILLIQRFNELLQQKKDGLELYSENSDNMKALNEQIQAFKVAIKDNLEVQRRKNLKTKQYLDQQINEVKTNYQAVPDMERQYIKLQSKFEIDEKVFRYLSEKKLEAQISKASIIPGSIIIDAATYSTIPVAPIAKDTYTLFLFAGFVSGILVIFGLRTIKPCIYDRETVESLTNVPIIGIIRKYTGQAQSDKMQNQALNDTRSPFSESVRAVRSNLNFLTTQNHSKVICITSEISGEGKSFIAINLATTLSLIEKKVILVTTDLRKCKTDWESCTCTQKGLSNYLAGQARIEEIIGTTSMKNLDIITSGPVPPNPSELLHTQKMKALIDMLKDKYDCILIDSAPIGLVSDAVPILRMADINLFIIRRGISGYTSATLPEKLAKELNLSNPAIILNAFEHNNFHGKYYHSQQINHNKDSLNTAK